MSQPLKVIFAGTPDFAIPSLKALLEHPSVDVVAVYSQPDRKAGRGKKLTATPIKQVALEHNIAVETPLNFKDEADRAQLKAYDADLMVVAAYGLLLPQSVLDIPKYGCINVHASLLPRWRGAAPIQQAILQGDAKAGVGIMRMEKGLDTGGVYCERSMNLDNQINAGELTDRLAALGADALIEAIEKEFYKTAPEPQPATGVTYAHKIKKADAQINWQQSAEEIQRHIRAYWPWPGAFTFYNNKRIKIAASSVIKTTDQSEPGTITAIDDDGITVQCGSNALLITQCQPEGKALGPAHQWKQYFSIGSLFNFN